MRRQRRANGANANNEAGLAGVVADRAARRTHLGDLPHVLNAGPFTGELGKYCLDLGNEAVDVEVGLGPAQWEVELWNAFTQHRGDGRRRLHLRLGNTRG